MFKIKIIYALAGLIILLVIADIFASISWQTDEKIVTPEITVKQIDSTVSKILDQHGIKIDWISRRSISDSENDSLKFVHRIKIPRVVPLPVLLADITNSFSDKPVSITSSEMTINGRTILKISSGDFLKYQVSLNYDNSLRRDIFSLAFVVNGIEEMKKTERENLLNLPFPITFILKSLGNSTEIINELENCDKKYAVEVDSENGSDKYKLDAGFQRSQLRNSIINLVKDFKEAPAFLYENNSSLRRSTIFNFVKDEFRKRGRILRNKSDFISLEGENLNDRLSLLRFHCSSFTPGEIKIFSANAENFNQIIQVLWDVKNKGNNFIDLNEVY